MRPQRFQLPLCLILTIFGWPAAPAFAQNIPPAAEVDRYQPPEPRKTETYTLTPHAPAAAPQAAPMPGNADAIFLTLKSVTLKGNTVFPQDALAKYWRADLNKKITLARVYKIADEITAYYRDKGYVLARAYLPAQEIEGGNVIIQVTEGTIGDIQVEGPFPVKGVLAGAVNILRDMNPLNIHDVESWISTLNDMYGASFKTVFKPDKRAGHDGDILLVLVGAREKPLEAHVTFDTSGSRYLGPNTLTAGASYDYGDPWFQHTEAAYTTSLPTDELWALSLSHRIALGAGNWALVLSGDTVHGRPGYDLEPLDIASVSQEAGAALEWTPLRQRDAILTLRGKFDLRNSKTSIGAQDFTRDRIRALRLSAHFENVDSWNGANGMEMSLEKGFYGTFGASHKNDPDLSRAQGDPGFFKMTMSLSRQQKLNNMFSLVAQASGQATHDALLSSEEFGYGGPQFGRAYDPSEIVGDQGVAASLELRHKGWEWNNASLQPYVFYDLGKVWNYDAGQPKTESGASAGVGARLFSEYGVSASLALAEPLTRRIGTPEPYESHDGPRVQFQMSAKY